MASPVWQTPSGTLGTIQEQVFFELEIDAIDPDFPDDSQITYKIIAGSLPPGIVMYPTGSLRGQPKGENVNGVPASVKQDVTSTFCCRATNTRTNQISDRTFSLTVTGEDPPVLITNKGEIGRFLDGTYVDIKLEAVDLDNEPIAWSITDGALPPGLSMDLVTGEISGYARQAPLNNVATDVGWSSDVPWDKDPWDYGSRANSLSYQFTVQVTDGKMFDISTYSIFIYSHDAMTADTDYITADNFSTIEADTDTKRNPVLLTQAQDLGVYMNDNYFAFHFDALDFDGDQIGYSLLVSADIGFDNEPSGYDSTIFDEGDLQLPPGLILNTETGWLYGQIPRQIAAQTEYSFAVQVYKKNYSSYKSRLTYFTLTIINDLRYLVKWISPADLGTLETGAISELSVVATNPLGRPLIYTIKSGRLPQGLNLLNDGLIVGRSSFEMTTFDAGDLTFDKDVRKLGSLSNETTIDRDYTFTIQATDANGDLLAFRTFTIHLFPSTFGPYESLYLRAQPDLDEREIINQVIKNTDVIPSDILYRNNDPNFGLSKDLRMLVLSGITASSPSDYIEAMATNHYRKSLKLGDYTWAQALDDAGNHVYDVVYIKVVDDLTIDTAHTIPQSIDLSNQITRQVSTDDAALNVSTSLSTIDGLGDLTVYPNSILNMRSVIRQKLSLATKEPLPRWMNSKQTDGRIPGWTPSIVIAYVAPGQGDKVVFNLNRLVQDIRVVDFDVDRYIWDTNLSKNWDISKHNYDVSKLTTFDVEENPTATVATVDFAVEVPFDYINDRTSAFIDALGGLDGIIDEYVGKRIIFAQQEHYSGFTGEEDGWVRYHTVWDDEYGWSSYSVGWDDYDIIPGFFEVDQSIANQRAAVWKIQQDTDGVIRLVVDSYINLGDTVEITYGHKYGGYVLQYGPHIIYSDNETVPRYHVFNSSITGVPTVFDGNKTRFVDSITVYQEPDEGDKYLAFPRTNIWA